MAPAKFWRDRPLLATGQALIGLALIAWAYLMVSEESPFPGVIALVPVVGTVLVLLSGSGAGQSAAQNLPNAFLSLPPMQWLGKLSYSLYLWHWPVIVYAAMLVPTFPASSALPARR